MKNVSELVNASRCIGCCACYAVCPADAIQIVFEGIYTPRIDPYKCRSCGRCYNVCPISGPSGLVEDVSLQQELSQILSNSFLIGVKDRDITDCSSGGFVTGLLAFAMTHGIIDGALIVVSKKRFLFKADIAEEESMILHASGSKYGPVAWGSAIKAIIRNEGKYAIVGLPCHIRALKRMMVLMPTLTQRVLFTISLFCTGGVKDSMAQWIVRDLKIPRNKVEDVKFRSGEWPGEFAIQWSNDTSLKPTLEKRPFSSYIGTLLNSRFFQNTACFSCYDFSGRYADVSCGDPWGVDKSILKQKKWTLAIVRSCTVLNLVKTACNKGMLEWIKLDSNQIIRTTMILESIRRALHNELITREDLPVEFALGRIWMVATQTVFSKIGRSKILVYLPRFVILVASRLDSLIKLVEYSKAKTILEKQRNFKCIN